MNSTRVSRNQAHGARNEALIIVGHGSQHTTGELTLPQLRQLSESYVWTLTDDQLVLEISEKVDDGLMKVFMKATSG